MSDETIITDEELRKYNEKIKRYERRQMHVPSLVTRQQVDEMDEVEKARLKEDIEDFLRKDSMREDKQTYERKWFKRSYARKVEQANEEHKDLFDVADKISQKFGGMGSVNQPRGIDNKFDDFTHQQRVKSFEGLQGLASHLSYRNYKANYLKAIETEFGELSTEYSILKEIVESIDPKDLMKLYRIDPDLQIEFVYSQGEASDYRAEIIIEAFKRAGYIPDTVKYEDMKAKREKELDNLLNDLTNMYDVE